MNHPPFPQSELGTFFYTIWDIDNCLADDHWRQELIEWNKQGDARYQLYNEAASLDVACNVHLFKLFRQLGARPVFFSGRPEAMRKISQEWLERCYDLTREDYDLYMRDDGTVGLTPRKCKEAMLINFLRRLGPEGQHGEIIAAFDDIPAIINMYRSYDIPATVLAIHEDLTGAYQAADLK